MFNAGRRSSCPPTGGMEVQGQLITMAAGNIGSPGSQRYTKAMKMKTERRKELAARQQKIEENLRGKIADLKKLCLKEAELTGRLPAEYPLEPGEKPPVVVRWERASSRALDPSTKPAEGPALRDLDRRFELQQRIARAELAEKQRARREYEYHHRRLPDDRSMEIQRASHLPRDEARLTASLLTDGRSSPRLDGWGDGRTVGHSQGWTLLPTDIYCQARGRRNSYANPARMLQRSMSGAVRRSVPSSPVIYRDRPGLSRYLSPASRRQQLMDTTDSRTEVSSDTGAERPAAAGRTRRSSSSEMLSEGAGLPHRSCRLPAEGPSSTQAGQTAGRSGAQSASGYYPQQHPVPVSLAGGAHRQAAAGGRVDRDVHRALALEGLRAWYVRTATYGHQQERTALGWDHRLHPTGAARPVYSPATPRANWEAWRRPGTSGRAGVTTRGRWCDPPC
ncbi:coiled-coil domain-containing protein 120-like isoform X1 [Heterodontus francisci]|uniref:coiled-coil domain-containing protein 120-like isoform X1 n=2 Tax=Heterodontus francisci TaxID=7792 RepID=UPI00355C644A